MRIQSIEIRLLDLPLTEPFSASHGTTTSRTVSIVTVTTDHSVGWGECSALPSATYTAESAAGSYQLMAKELAPPLLGVQIADAFGPPAGDNAIPPEVQRLLDAGNDAPMARSGLEMAMLDAVLSSTDTTLVSWLLSRSAQASVDDSRSSTEPVSVAAGVSVGLGTIDGTVEACVGLVEDGYRRLKVKIQPGHDLELVEAIRAAVPDGELQVDGNGAYGATVDHLVAVAEAGADVIEQPFPADEPTAAADLIIRLDELGLSVPVVADEAVERIDQAKALLAAKAMTGLSIKPARVGGLTHAVALHDLCRSAGVAATAGGMLETGLGRHALVALAALPGFTITGDLSPAGRWLAVDPWPELVMADGRLLVPTGPGIAPEPDLDVIDGYTVERTVLRR